MNVAWAHTRDLGADDARDVGTDDARLPQLAWFADAERVLPVLGRAFTVDAESCELFNVWHIPAKSLRVVYQLHGPSIDGTSSLICVDFRPSGSSGFPSAPRALHLSEWNALAWRMVDDPDLPNLRAVFARADSSWSVLSYLPRKRCVLRRPYSNGLVVGKIEQPPLVNANHGLLLRLWHAPGRTFRMPRPLFADTTLGVRWEEYVDARRFGAAPGAAGLEPVVEALAGLHATQLDGLRSFAADDVLDHLQRKVMPRVSAALPLLAPLATDIAHRLRSSIPSLPRHSSVTIHGDLHTANTLIDRHGAILIDLDSVCRGDPALDLALLGSRLLLQALVAGRDVSSQAEMVAELPRVYASWAERPVPDPTFAWYLAALLLSRQVKTCIRHHAPDLERIVRTLLRWSADILSNQRFEAGVCAS